MLTGYTIDVFRELDEQAAEEDIYLDEFSDESISGLSMPLRVSDLTQRARYSTLHVRC